MKQEEVMKQRTASSWILRVILSLAVALPVLGTRPLHAQVDTGSISGVVSDPSGAVLHDANVTLTNEGTNSSLTTKAGSDGRYVFSPVRIGSYTIAATYQGFQTTEQKNVTVNVGQDVVANFTLKPGQVTETVEVTPPSRYCKPRNLRLARWSTRAT